MKSPIRVQTVAAVVALVFSLGARAAAQVPGAQPAPLDRQAAIEETQQIRQRLAAIADQAFQRNPALKQEVEQIDDEVSRAMRENDPQVEQDLARLKTLEQQLQAARDAHDTDRMQAILAEGSQVVERLERARAQALARPEIARRIDAFQDQLLQAMTGVDPEAPRLMQRLEEISARFH